MTNALEDIWADDRLSRKDDAEFLQFFLKSRATELAASINPRSFVLNIDSRWGNGKTFFLQRFRKQLIASEHLAVYVNAWEDDFSHDPFMAVLAAIDRELAIYFPKQNGLQSAWATAKSTGGRVARLMAIGLAKRAAGAIVTAGVAEAIAETISTGFISKDDEKKVEKVGAEIADDATEAIGNIIDKQAEEGVSEFNLSKDLISDFKSKLSNFITYAQKELNKEQPIYILVDELDRCRPTYAIAMLERIKHIFDLPNIVFVIATDTSQLVHSISAVYGREFDSNKYLKRFFDQSYIFDDPDPEAFVVDLLKKYPIDPEKCSTTQYSHELNYFIVSFFKYIDVDLRSTEKIYFHLRDCISAWDYNVKVELTVICPIIAFFHNNSRNDVTYDNLLKSRNSARSWILPVISTDELGFEKEFDPVNVFSIGLDFFRTSNQSMEGNLVNSIRKDWIRDRIDLENNILNSGETRGNMKKSVVSKYPELVRKCGRLK
jgi:hypothetical protein